MRPGSDSFFVLSEWQNGYQKLQLKVPWMFRALQLNCNMFQISWKTDFNVVTLIMWYLSLFDYSKVHFLITLKGKLKCLIIVFYA